MPKGTIHISFDNLSRILAQVVYLPPFTVTGAWVGCHGVEVHIQSDGIGEGLSLTAAILTGEEPQRTQDAGATATADDRRPVMPPNRIMRG
jgi:hypothetical protein